MSLELVSEEETVVVSQVIKTIDVIVDDEVVANVIVEPEVTVTAPSQEVLFSVDTPGPPGPTGIIASPEPPPDPVPGQLWVELP